MISHRVLSASLNVHLKNTIFDKLCIMHVLLHMLKARDEHTIKVLRYSVHFVEYN
jgi:hypothetical protein